MLAEPFHITEKVIEALDELGISYLIGGSLASAIHGTARTTLDADLLADLNEKHVQPLVDLLQSEFYIDAEMILEAIAYRSSFNLIHLETMFKIDIFVAKDRPYDREQLKRRVRKPMSTDSPQEAYFCTPEDIILAKLEWFRLGGEVSDRQWRDLLGVLKLQGDTLDQEYLARWAGELGVSDLMVKAMKEAVT